MLYQRSWGYSYLYILITMKDYKNITTFSIADIPIALYTDYPLTITKPFELFQTESKEDAIQVELLRTETVTVPQQEAAYGNIFFKVYEDERGFYRIFHDHKENDRPYAVGRILSENRERITYASDSEAFFSESSNAFSHIAFERLLLQKDAIILHASFIETAYGGILFSGPSGVGKSTQADLWKMYENAELINGDRTILRQKEGAWRGYGSPYAGSSRCFVNKSKEIRCIVILKQAEQCHIRRLSSAMAFMKIYEGIIINTWNEKYMQKAANLIETLVKKVPVYLMECTPDQEAVELLKKRLRNEGEHESR